MRILVTGATGFIGGYIASALLRQGYQVVAATRHPCLIPGCETRRIEFAQLIFSEDWLPHLAGIDAVVNCVGIIAENRQNRFEDLHHRAPAALFAACAQAGVGKVVQISALGADASAFSRYHLSKKAADDALAACDLDWAIVQPSLVYGAGGASFTLFSALAALPVWVLPGDGGQRMQPVQIDDLTEAVLRLLAADAPTRLRIAAVGPQPETLAQMLASLRDWLGLPPAPRLQLPFAWILACVDAVGRCLPGPLNGEALRMLQHGNTADAAPFAALLGRVPVGWATALAQTPAHTAQRWQARLFFLLPALRYALGFLWVWSGLVSAFIYPVADSYALLEKVGINGWFAPVTLYAASLLDTVLGLALICRFKVKTAAYLQIGVILAYSSVIAIFLPEYWLHPFAPIIKNLPLLLATAIILTTEDKS